MIPAVNLVFAQLVVASLELDRQFQSARPSYFGILNARHNTLRFQALPFGHTLLLGASVFSSHLN
jgi:hypothetical protein